MKYVARINKSIDRMSDEQLLYELLKVRGVENPSGLLNLTENVLHDPYLFKNLQFGLDMLKFYLEKEDSHIHIFFDTDCDGLTSGALVYLWIQRNFPNVKLTFDCNEGKIHGLNEDIVSRIPNGTNLVIAPDSSSSDLEWHEVLDEKEIDLLILDHHEIDRDIEGTPACVINNQDGSYPNPTLSAPGVVYKFLGEFEQRYFKELGLEPNINEYLDIIATGIVADSCDLRNEETRYLVLKGLEIYGKDNLLLQALLEEASKRKDVTEPTIDTIGWDVAPPINAIFRQGGLEDRYDLFKALTNHVETRVHIPSRKTKDNPDKSPIEESLQANVLRRAKTIKGQQDRTVKKELEVLEGLILSNNLLEEKVLIVDADGYIERGHSGLIAGKLASKYKKPVLILSNEGGSGRNYDKFPINNLNDWLSSSELITCSGHQGAFGLAFNKNNINTLREWCNQQLEGQDLTPAHHVDMEIDIKKLKNKHILKVGKMMPTFGGKGMDKPTFAITNIVIETADVQRLGQTSTMMKFVTNINGEEITFIRPFTSTDKYKEFICDGGKSRGLGSESTGNKKIEATIIGTFGINKFNGKDYPQILIEEFVTKSVDNGGRRRRRF